LERLEHIKQLYRQYLAKTISDADKRQLMDFFATGTDAELQEVIGPLLPAEVDNLEDLSAYDDRTERILERVRHWTTAEEPVAHRRKRLWLPYAAAVAAILAVGWFFLDNRQRPTDNRLVDTEILPGGNRATLSVAGGPALLLDSTQSGIIFAGERVMYGNSQPIEGLILHNDNFDDAVKPLTLATPKGGTYQVTLPDGSRVWLNAASALTYPSRFEGNERVVELVGEAYFEVNRRKVDESTFQPFKVISKGQSVEVLGTQFNISAYADEKETRTTLVEGSVRLSLARELSEASLVPDKQVVLAPGEQGILTPEGLSKQHVDTEPYTAWKNGRISFNDQPIDAIMRGVARWYDVDVVYEGELPEDKFGGTVSRFDNVSSVLRTLELTGRVRFRVEGRTIYVSK